MKLIFGFIALALGGCASLDDGASSNNNFVNILLGPQHEINKLKTEVILAQMNSNFIEIEPTTPPINLVGTWTGGMGRPYTWRISDDGRMIICSAVARDFDKGLIRDGFTYQLEKAKFSNGLFHQQNGFNHTFISADAGILTIRSKFGAHENESVLLRDDELNHASIQCAEKLAKM